MPSNSHQTHVAGRKLEKGIGARQREKGGRIALRGRKGSLRCEPGPGRTEVTRPANSLWSASAAENTRMRGEGIPNTDTTEPSRGGYPDESPLSCSHASSYGPLLMDLIRRLSSTSWNRRLKSLLESAFRIFRFCTLPAKACKSSPF